MKINVARNVSKKLSGVTAIMNETIRDVMENDTEEVFVQYRALGGQIMGIIFLDILTKIYDEHPQLRPPELRD